MSQSQLTEKKSNVSSLEHKADIKADIKVLHLIDSGGLYGAEKMLLALVAEQVKQGLQPMILSAGDLGVDEKPLELEAKRLGLPIKVWRMKAGFNIPSTKKIINWADGQGCTHFHSHGFKFNVLLALTSLSGLKQKLVTTVHGYVGGKRFSKRWFYEVLDGFALWRFTSVVVVSEPMLCLSVIRRMPRSKVKVISNGISGECQSNDLPKDITNFIAQYSNSVIAVGRLSKEKGFDLLVEAVANLDEPVRDKLAVVIVGEGGCRESLESQIARLGLSNIMLAGYRDDAGAMLIHFDALIMPSLTEGLPITLLEAMRSSVPVCATRVGGIPSVLSESDQYLIEPNNVKAIEAFLNRLVVDKNSIAKSVGANKNYFDRYLSSAVMAEQYMELVY